MVCFLLAGCSQTTESSRFQYNPNVNTVTASGHSTLRYRVLHNFGKPLDGSNPAASLIDVGGILYGTTQYGGKGKCAYGLTCGTVFNITTDGKETVLHRFVGVDGANPVAPLIEVRGTLYGTTSGGGTDFSSSGGGGTVFSITTKGSEKVLHSFGLQGDGAGPSGGLINVRGTLYGTTEYGGYGSGCVSGTCGTVFSITTSGKEKVLYIFRGRPRDGDYPVAGLTDVGGTLYGTTYYGGRDDQGTVFSITTSGKEKALYSFGRKPNEGANPSARMINLKGTLYGTTQYSGGGFCYKKIGCGTVFSITTAGKLKTLHLFVGDVGDGGNPTASLIDVSGKLYGTTRNGGAYCRFSQSCGTLFSLTSTGVEKILHSFGDASDGNTPAAGLIEVSGTLYGTTSAGGVRNNNGTVFALTP